MWKQTRSCSVRKLKIKQNCELMWTDERKGLASLSNSSNKMWIQIPSDNHILKQILSGTQRPWFQLLINEPFCPKHPKPKKGSDKGLLGHKEPMDNSPGGRDCFSFSAFSLSVMTKVYKNLEHRTLNLVFSAFFFILTAEIYKIN